MSGAGGTAPLGGSGALLDSSIPSLTLRRRAAPPASLPAFAGVAVAYFLVAQVSFGFVPMADGMPSIWPPSGVFLAALLLVQPARRLQLAAVLFLVDLSGQLLAGAIPALAIAYSTALTADALLGAWLLTWVRRRTGQSLPFRFDRVVDILSFAALSLVLSNGVCSVLAAAAAHHVLGTDLTNAWISWAVPDGIGSLVVTPLLLTWVPWLRSGGGLPGAARVIEGGAIVGLVVVVDSIAFGQLPIDTGTEIAVTYLSVPFLAWASVRFGIRGATLAVAAGATAAVTSATLSHGAQTLPQHQVFDAIVVLELYVGVFAAVALILAIALTERDRVRRDLAEAQRVAHVGSWTWDPVTGRTTASQELLRIIGASTADPVTSLADQAQFFTDESRERLVAEIRRTVETGQPFEASADVIGLDDVVRHVVARGELVPGSEGTGKRLRGTLSDVTELREAELALLDAQQRLSQRERIDSLGRLSEGVAYEVNNLLYGIRVLAALIRDDRGGSSTSEWAAEIVAATDKGTAMTGEMLGFAGIGHGEPRDVDVSRFLEGSLGLVRARVGPTIEVDAVLPEGLPPARVAPDALAAAVLGLALRAASAMPLGGRVSISVAAAQRVDAEASRLGVASGTYVCVTVSDTGASIPSELLERAMEPYSSEERQNLGTGFEVAAAYGFARASGGSFEVESGPDGSAVRLYLPVAP